MPLQLCELLLDLCLIATCVLWLLLLANLPAVHVHTVSTPRQSFEPSMHHFEPPLHHSLHAAQLGCATELPTYPQKSCPCPLSMPRCVSRLPGHESTRVCLRTAPRALLRALHALPPPQLSYLPPLQVCVSAGALRSMHLHVLPVDSHSLPRHPPCRGTAH